MKSELPTHHVTASMKVFMLVFAVVLLVTLSWFVWDNNMTADDSDYSAPNVLQQAATANTSPVIAVNTEGSLGTDQEDVHAALVLYLQENGSGVAKLDPMNITYFKSSGDFVRFTAAPRLYSKDLDPADGFAKKSNGIWKILSLGTGGDQTNFYKEQSIPAELQD